MRKLENPRGVTLLEVLMAMGLVSVALLALSGFATTIMKGASSSQKMTTAVTLAQDKIEDLRRGGYDRALMANRSVIEPYDSIVGFPAYKRTALTEIHVPASGMQTVTVEVYWDADDHSIALTTVFTE